MDYIDEEIKFAIKKANDLLKLQYKLSEKEKTQKIKFGTLYPETYPKNEFKTFSCWIGLLS